MSNVTLIQVQRQLLALDSDSFEVGILDGLIREDANTKDNDKKMFIRSYTKSEVIKSVGYLRHNNVNKKHIFIRPASQNGLIFFDDFSITKVKKIIEDGINIGVCIESSPRNYQGWIRFYDGSVANDLATSAAQLLAKKYGGDINSADWRHFGRLSGFTNCKPKYIDELGRYPFCKLYSYSTDKKYNKNFYNESVAFDNAKKEDNLLRIKDLNSRIIINDSVIEAGEIFSRIVRLSKEKYGSSYNASRTDWKAVNKLVDLGFSEDAIKYSLLNSSEKANRSSVNTAKYVEDTINKVMGRKDL